MNERTQKVPEVAEGEIVDTKVTSIGNHGTPCGYLSDGRVVFIDDHTIGLGDKVRIRVTKSSFSFAHADVVEVLSRKGEAKREPRGCDLCGQDIEIQPDGYRDGHNAEPVLMNGRCCDTCNTARVIPARLRIAAGEPRGRVPVLKTAPKSAVKDGPVKVRATVRGGTGDYRWFVVGQEHHDVLRHLAGKDVKVSCDGQGWTFRSFLAANAGISWRVTIPNAVAHNFAKDEPHDFTLEAF